MASFIRFGLNCKVQYDCQSRTENKLAYNNHTPHAHKESRTFGSNHKHSRTNTINHRLQYLRWHMNQSHEVFGLCGTGQNSLVFVESTSCILQSVVGAPLPVTPFVFAVLSILHMAGSQTVQMSSTPATSRLLYTLGIFSASSSPTRLDDVSSCDPSTKTVNCLCPISLCNADVASGPPGRSCRGLAAPTCHLDP